MFFRKQAELGMWLSSILILLMLVAFTVNISKAQQQDESARSYMIKIEKSTPREVYNTLSVFASRAFMIHLTEPSDTEALEQLVTMCDEYIAKYPTSGQLKEVNYYLGTALVRLGKFQKGVPILERLLETISPYYIAVTQYNKANMNRFKWNLTERALLELGLAYDKQEEHNKADIVYNKLITHPKLTRGLPVRIARLMLESDNSTRSGEVPTGHNAWIGKTAPNFWMGFDESIQRKFSLNRYKGHVVLLCYGASDLLNLNLEQLHDKYKNQKFQIITVDPDVSDPPMAKSVEMKGEAWIHYHDKLGKLINKYQIRTLPAVFLIDSEGIIRKTHLDAASLEKAVDELVKENLANYNDPRSQAIIAKAVDAHGGLEKLKVVKNMVLDMNIFDHNPNGSVSEEQTSQMILFRDKVYQTYLYDDGLRSTRIYDGTSIYDIEGTGKIVKLDDQYEEYQIGLNKDFVFTRPIWLLTTLSQNELTIEYLGTKNVDGESATVLRVPKPSGELVKIYINNLTYFIVRLETEEERENENMSFEHYKDVDGIKMSHYWIEKRNSHYEFFINKIYINAEIDPKLFDPNSDANKGAKLPYVKSDNVAENDETKIKEIVAKAVEAHGGLEKLKTVENIVMDFSLFGHRLDGTVAEEQTGQIILYRDKHYQDIVSETGEKGIRIFDGTTVYTIDVHGNVKTFDGQRGMGIITYIKDWLFKMPIWLLTTLAQNEIPIEYIGTENVNGEPATVLKVKQPSGRPLQIFISEETNYILQMKYKVEDVSKYEVTTFEQYKDVDGIKMSHYWIENYHTQNEIFLNKIRFNVEIHPNLFDPNSGVNKGAKLPDAKPNNVAENDVTKIKEIVAKAVEAHGGLEKLKTVENIVMDMRLFERRPDGLDDDGGGKIYLYRDKLRMEFYTETGERFAQLFDGTSMYNVTTDGTFEQMPQQEAKSRIEFCKDWLFREPIWLLTTLAQNEIPIEYVGTKDVDGVSAAVLSVQQPSGTPLKIYISEKTNYIVLLETKNERLNTVSSLVQYKDIDGIKIAHKWIEMNEPNPETHFIKIRLNAEIAPELFNPKK